MIANYGQEESWNNVNAGVVKVFSVTETGFKVRIAGTSSTVERGVMWIAIGE